MEGEDGAYMDVLAVAGIPAFLAGDLDRGGPALSKSEVGVVMDPG